MKALSIKPHWAGFIVDGQKTIEIRSRRCNYRGPLLICVSGKPVKGYESCPRGVTLCIVDVVDCHRMTLIDERRSGVKFDPAMWSWELANVRPVEQVPVKGKLGFFDVPDRLIKPARVNL